MDDWLAITELAKVITEERIRGRRSERVILERFSPTRALRPIVRALMAFLF